MLKAFFFIFFFLVLISADSSDPLTAANYNEERAKKIWTLCMGSYCSPSRISSWQLGFVSDIYKDVTDITLVINSTNEACGFTAYSPIDNEVLIVFRGTLPFSIKNWMDDLDAFITDYPNCAGCKVHEGFYHTYLAIKDTILSSARALFAKYPKSKKLITGHSLGGALATLAAIDIQRYFGPVDEFYTYGSPRVGNREFATFTNGFVTGNFNSRITHNRDPVPHLPFQNLGFYHVDKEVFYDQYSSSYKICNSGEDPSCSNNYLDILITDHWSYMGNDLVVYNIQCNL